MARPRKWRQVCFLPEQARFGPLEGACKENYFVSMTIEEYETIRLMDKENFTQEKCAIQMHIARTTVQGLYNTARRKLAESLVLGKILIIEGGVYELCNGKKENCACSCRWDRHAEQNTPKNREE